MFASKIRLFALDWFLNLKRFTFKGRYGASFFLINVERLMLIESHKNFILFLVCNCYYHYYYYYYMGVRECKTFAVFQQAVGELHQSLPKVKIMPSKKTT